MLKSNIWFYVLLVVYFGLTFLFSTEAEGAEVRKLTFTAAAYQGTNHDPYLLIDNLDERLQHITSVAWDVDMWCTAFNQYCIYWNNDVIGKASSKQYRSVEWSFEVGMAFPYVDLFFGHMSRHILEGVRDIRFPLENVIGFRMKFIEKSRGRGW
jgi:hypothetical protein